MKGVAELFTTAIGNAVLLTVDATECTGGSIAGGSVTVDTSTIGGAGVEARPHRRANAALVVLGNDRRATTTCGRWSR